jgi:hypothetical protein
MVFSKMKCYASVIFQFWDPAWHRVMRSILYLRDKNFAFNQGKDTCDSASSLMSGRFVGFES